MKTLDQKSADYSAKLSNQSGNYTKGEIETAYILGATDNAALTAGSQGTFGQAIASLKRGEFVTRKGWNGKGMYLWLKQSAIIQSDWCKDPILKKIVDDNGGKAEALATICMRTANNEVLTGWLASQSDMLADDWMMFEF